LTNHVFLYPKWAIVILIIVIINVILRLTVFADKYLSREKWKFTLVAKDSKHKFERRILDIASIFSIWYIAFLLVFNPWVILERNAFLGGLILIAIFTYPFGSLTAYIYGLSQQTNKFDDYLLFTNEKDVHQTTIELMETFTDPELPIMKFDMEAVDDKGKKHIITRTFGVIFKRAENIKDAWNENHKVMLIDSFRDSIWKMLFDEDKCTPIWADEILEVGNKKVIQTYKRLGKEIYDCLLTAVNDIDLRQRYLIVEQNKKQEEAIVKLEEDNHLLRSQRKKGVLDQTSRRLGVFFALFEKSAGDTTDEKEEATKLADEGIGIINQKLSEAAET